MAKVKEAAVLLIIVLVLIALAGAVGAGVGPLAVSLTPWRVVVLLLIVFLVSRL